MTPRVMRVINRLFERIKNDGNIGYTDLIIAEHISNWTLDKLKPILLDLHQEITYENRRFWYLKVVEVESKVGDRQRFVNS